MSKSVTRLYEQFVPAHYDLAIEISENKESFTGTTVVTGKKVGRPSKRLTLHQKNLKIGTVTVEMTDKKGVKTELTPSRVVSHKAYDEVRIHFDQQIFPGSEFKITIDYSGAITDNMDGIYPSRFKHDGKDKKLIGTQFESHHAREAFPCVDEPEAKATFAMTLTHDADEMALGNTPIASETEKNGRKTTTYEPTPIMSTYLVAFVIGEMKYKEAKSKSGVTIRTYATPDQVDNTQFALDVAVYCMEFYEQYYDIPFPLEKCDFVALPDFASGAMENWGLITFREQALLVNDEITSLNGRQWVALVVAHELTHQWFGNLVTMSWWTDLWLNEGFASWMEYIAVNDMFPEWHLWTQFAIDEQQSAMKADALEHTHPVEVPVHHPDEIRTIFDMISYQKGASVIHMLHDYLGAEGFRDGLRHYLKKHSYKNTVTIDLWQALEDVTKKPVKEFMNAWTSQSGFPIVNVSVDNDHLKVTQQRYVSNPTSKARQDKTTWPIPLLTDGLDRAIADKAENNIPITGEAPLQLNVGQTGFYRTSYSHDMQDKQLAAIDAGQLDTIDRMGLLADSFDTVKSGYQSVDEFLDLLAHFANEEELSTWEIMIGGLGSVKAVLSSTDDSEELRDAMKPFVQKLVQKQYDRLGWKPKKDESHLDALLRPVIISAACSVDLPDALETADKLYSDLIENGTGLFPDIRGTVLSTAARRGGEKEFEQMLDMYNNSDSSDEKMSLTGAMTSFEQPEIHTKVLDMIKTDTIRNQDISYWLAYSLMNRHSRQQAWKWVRDNWDWMKATIGTDLSFSRTPVYVARVFADDAMLDEYKNFFEPRLEPILQRTYNQGLEVIETNAAWRKRDAQTALDWFSKTSQRT